MRNAVTLLHPKHAIARYNTLPITATECARGLRMCVRGLQLTLLTIIEQNGQHGEIHQNNSFTALFSVARDWPIGLQLSACIF